MNGRELVILLLGLAIVAVVLRGLYVAINARRGQIKLAIDKNIPQNVDLESLELAELPGGGARVVTRSLEEVNRQNNALDLAETKAKSLNLTDAEIDGHIPVLMDAVELSEPAVTRVIPPREDQQEVEAAKDLAAETAFAGGSVVEEPVVEEADVVAQEEQNESIEEEAEDDFIPHASQEHSIGEDWEEAESEAETEDDYSESQADQENAAQNEDDSNSALFDYDEEELEEDEARSNVDAMSSIAPDYAAGPEVADEGEAFSTESVEMADDDSYGDDEESNLDDDLYEQAEQSEQELTQVQEQELPAPFDADSSVDEFSMTAGERIGGSPSSIDEADQTGLFDDIDKNAVEVADKPKSSRSLFSLFGRKSKQRRESLDDEQPATPVTTNIEMEAPAVDELDDVLLEEERAQVDIEEVEHEESMTVEPAYVEPVVGEETIDELDQKRAASLEQAPEEQEAHSDEFEPSEVLVLNVTAKDGRVFSGDDLLQVLITSGLKFGDMNIFHKRLSKEQQGTVIFSVANMLNPGTFDLNNMDEFTTLGISFFLALPTPINNLDAFEQMLGVAQEIRDTLGGDLKDDHRNGMTGQTIEHYRQRIRDFELRRLKAVAARG
ncbi:MAG: cell division protein ZipA [SAR86 cluster bacterium]|uniref:Cell division protein ZipA n=1 Tax=SAR86 cluster bacterium TaxID=2030880 RepID=A0A2A4WY50_9GAMM|nr:MAG: cell division protein ZipA [SAR86 cluster bacterium]